jgi:hypothetical protein
MKEPAYLSWFLRHREYPLQDIVTTTNRKKIWRNIATLVVIGLALYLILPQINALSNSWQVLIKLKLWAVGLAFLAQGMSYLGSGYLLKRTLEISGPVVSMFRSVLIILGTASIVLVTGGTVSSSAMIFRWTSEEKRSRGGSALASILPSLFNSFMLLVFSIFGLAQLILGKVLSRSQLLGFSITFGFLGLAVALAILASHYRKWITAAMVWIGQRAARFKRKPFYPQKTVKETDKIFLAWDALWRGKWPLLTLGAFLNILFDMLTLYLLFIAAGNNITLGMLLTGYALPLLLGRLAFILPGGVGVVETSMVALYASLGIPNATAVVVVGAYRLISFWIPTIAGFPIAAYLQRTR